MLMRTSPQISAGKYTTKSGIDLFGTIRAAKHYMRMALNIVQQPTNQNCDCWLFASSGCICLTMAFNNSIDLIARHDHCCTARRNPCA